MSNHKIATLLRKVAAAYEIKKEDRFRVVAYQRAADVIDFGTNDLRDMWEKGKLQDVAGIGHNIASHLDELFKTGKVKHFEGVIKDLPQGMFGLLSVPGIGPKNAYKLAKELKLKKEDTAVQSLEKAAKAGRIRKIEGFGEESEKDILKSIAEVKGRTGRIVLPQASAIAKEMLKWLNRSPFVNKSYPLGSLRRQVSTIGDIDIAVASDHPKEVIKHFIEYPGKKDIIEAGDVTSSIRLGSGIEIDLMVQPPEAFGALLQHFTGSKQHNIHLRELAIKKGLSLSEYGIKKKIGNARLAAGQGKWKMENYSTEEEFYKALGLVWIPPELREDKGEIEASLRSFQGLKNGLPKLVEIKDLKGDLHVHSDFPIETSHDEGRSSIQAILTKAKQLGYEYIGFSEHNPSFSHHSSHQIIDILKRKKELIDHINYSRENINKDRVNKVFVKAINGLEIDIKPKGALAIPEEGLYLLDYAIVSVHASFRLTRKEMTKRVLDALNHPKAKILGHPTGRKLGIREGFELEWDKIFDFCLKNNKWLEINAWPERLDLPDDLVFEAVKRGVKIVISTDSHQADQMDLMAYGVSVARRGWAEKKDIANTLGYNEFIAKAENRDS